VVKSCALSGTDFGSLNNAACDVAHKRQKRWPPRRECAPAPGNHGALRYETQRRALFLAAWPPINASLEKDLAPSWCWMRYALLTWRRMPSAFTPLW